MNEQNETIFDRAKSVSALAAAERYANVVPKGTRRVTVCCPIHRERTPSCVFYEDGTFHCFGCHAGGTSIDLVMSLFHLRPLDAAKRICADFGLDPGRPMDAARRKHMQELRSLRAAANSAASYANAVQCAVIRWCEDRLDEFDRDDDSEGAEDALASLLSLRQDAINMTDAIRAIDNMPDAADRISLLQLIQRVSVVRADVLGKWDEMQGSHYVKAVET